MQLWGDCAGLWERGAESLAPQMLRPPFSRPGLDLYRSTRVAGRVPSSTSPSPHPLCRCFLLARKEETPHPLLLSDLGVAQVSHVGREPLPAQFRVCLAAAPPCRIVSSPAIEEAL